MYKIGNRNLLMETFDVDSNNLSILPSIYKVFKTKSLSEQLLPIIWQLPFQARGDQTGPKKTPKKIKKLTCQSYEDINHFLLGFFSVCVSNTFSLKFWHFCSKLCPHAFHFNVTAGFPSLKPVRWAHLSCTLRMACATIKQLFDPLSCQSGKSKGCLGLK